MLQLQKTAHTAIAFAVSTLLLAACGGSGGADAIAPNDGPSEVAEYVTPAGVVVCSAEDIKGRVDFDMRDYYIYYDQVPQVNSQGFDTPEEFIRELRVDPDVYSYVGDEQEQGAFFEEGITRGFGFNFRPAGDGVVRFKEILRGSPAERAGIVRGDELVSLNNRLISEYSNDDFRETFADGEPPVTMQIRTANEAPREAVLDAETFSWLTTSYFIYRAEGLPTVGLIEVRSFFETTANEISESIRIMRDAGIDELIVDFRYNPGGRTRVAQQFAAQIAGSAIDGEPFLSRVWNDKYTQFNQTSVLQATTPTLALPRAIFLMTESSASASEAMVNGLEPYIDVVVIGGATRGKIFTSNARGYCGKSINAMRSTRTNSVGVSVQGGIQPDCSVTDDWTTSALSTEDPLVSAALNYVLTGTCPDTSIASAARSNRSGVDTPSFNSIGGLADMPMDLVD